MIVSKNTLDKADKMLIKIADIAKNTARKCEKHGLFFRKNETDNCLCPQCKKECEKVDNISELKEYVMG